jgi:DNA-binding CsgD family transcriptional regulator
VRCSTLDDVAANDAFAVQAVRQVAKLFAGTDSVLALIDADAMLVTTSGDAPERARPEDLFAAATVAQLRTLLSGPARDRLDEAHVVSGRTNNDEAVELRIVRAETGDAFLVLVRPVPEVAVADTALERARLRVRELSAALQAVADIIIPIEELQGHEEARRRAALVAPLSERERRVALAVADGVRTSQIANDLFVSQSTVRNYLPGIYRKLGVRSREGLAELLNSSD